MTNDGEAVSGAELPLRFGSDSEILTFVEDLYRIFSEREADPQGRAHYANLIKSGTSVGSIVAHFATGEEYIAKTNRMVILELITWSPYERTTSEDGRTVWTPLPRRFPSDYLPPGEAGQSYLERIRSGFLDRYCSGPVVLDVGYAGYDNPDKKTALPNAIGVDLEYPGYNGLKLPFEDASVDTVFSSHCLEHILYDHAAIRDWHRVLKVGGYIVCMVPSQALYEKRRFLPSKFNADHKRMYTPASLLGSFEQALPVNSYRVRHMAENDKGFNYELGPDVHSDGAYEIELVIEKIAPPGWELA